MVIPLIAALIALLGAGGTVIASDSARPGDILFPVDRATEEVQFAFTPGQSKAELKIKFAHERLDELESIVSEEHEDDDEDGDDSSASTTPEVSEQGRQNLGHALDILTTHLADIKGLASTTPGIAQAISVIEERLLADANLLPQELRIMIRDDRGRIELRTEEGKIKVKIKNGEIEVEAEFEDEDGDDDEDDDDDNSGPGSGSSATSTNSGDDDDDDDDADDDNSGSGSSGSDDDDADDTDDADD